MNFFAISFSVVVGDIEYSSDAELLLAYLNGADSYTNCSILYLHSNVINSLESKLLIKRERERVIATYKYNCNQLRGRLYIKTTPNMVINYFFSQYEGSSSMKVLHIH